MTTPLAADGGRRSASGQPEPPTSTTVGTAEHCVCGLTGALATAVIVALLYPTFLALTRPLHLLSSTTLVVLLATIWFVIWLGLEFLWEWRAGRL